VVRRQLRLRLLRKAAHAGQRRGNIACCAHACIAGALAAAAPASPRAVRRSVPRASCDITREDGVADAATCWTQADGVGRCSTKAEAERAERANMASAQGRNRAPLPWHWRSVTIDKIRCGWRCHTLRSVVPPPGHSVATSWPPSVRRLRRRTMRLPPSCSRPSASWSTSRASRARWA
jgi:hypothetical protein